MVRPYSDVLCRRNRDRVTASCCCGDDRRVGALIQPVSEPIHSGPLAISTVPRCGTVGVRHCAHPDRATTTPH